MASLTTETIRGRTAYVGPMATASPPPIEWVPAEQRWWLARIVVPFVAPPGLVLSLIIFWWRFEQGPVTWTWTVLFWGVISGSFGIQLLALYLLPSVRRIGFSPMYLFVDVGLTQSTYSWQQLREVTRTDVRRFRWNRTDSDRHTRIRVNAYVGSTSYTLTPNQGARLSRFLRIA